ncbi:MAG: hypothetical protein AYK23_00300 [Candidatus Proteinoplasmatales archaeon SG8-5]|nr:MAG: hypothetical protein AYK23_00300 [Candidatus Proteinoplasmatales archaeon SG8-5]
MTVGILGGGLTGISIGYFLKTNGYEFQILEGGSEPGGLCRSQIIGDFTFDIGGSHVIFSRNETTLALMLDILGDNVVKNRRNSAIFLEGKYVKYPLENNLADLEPSLRDKCLNDFVEAETLQREGKENLPENFMDWMYANFGAGISDLYLVPYNEKLWCTSPKDLGVDWVQGRVPKPPVDDVKKAARNIPTEGYKHQLNFYYPVSGGIQALTDTLIPTFGREKLITNAEVQQVSKRDGAWTVETTDGENRHYDKLISTIPIQNLAAAYDAIPEDVSKAVGNLDYVSIITVSVGVNKPQVSDRSWIYFPQKDIPFHRLSFPSNFSPDNAPKGHSSVLAEISCKPGSGLWNEPDMTIASRVSDTLERLEYFSAGEIVFTHVARNEFAYVLNDRGYSANKQTFESHFSDIGLILCGRFSNYEYLNMDRCIESAAHVAKKHFPPKREEPG